MIDLSSQTIGMIAGVVVFSATVVVTLLLLIFGGSFKRMREQASVYHGAGPNALKQALKPRPELYDELLEAARTLPRVPAPPPGGELRGQHVTLRTLLTEDAVELWEACNGSPKFGLAYDPEMEVWTLTPHGPFASVDELASSPLMKPLPDGLRFKVIDRETGGTIGMAAVLANEPLCLRAEVGDIWLNPAYKESRALQDVHYLLLDHLFGLGYRRVERRVDAGDVRARIDLPSAGFHLEGLLRKHMIVKGSNRDTAVFAMVNADWRDRAKATLEKILQADEDGRKYRKKKSSSGKTAATTSAASSRRVAEARVGTVDNGGSGIGEDEPIKSKDA